MAGASGACTAFNHDSLVNLQPLHALLWQTGTVTDLGNLGGTGHGNGIQAYAINRQDQVIGYSDLPGDTTFHSFLWSKETGMKDLGTLPAPFDEASLALGINDRGDVVGAALNASFFPTAVLWEKGASMPANLNGLIVGNPSGLTLLVAESINASGGIVGLAVTSTGETHAFLAMPNR